jgi:hypothetical protein
MNAEKVQVLLSMAEQLYTAAQEESMRSQEDVVTHLICHNSRQAVMNYLHGYLLINDTIPVEPMTLDALMAQCREMNPQFELADITDIDCRFETHDRDYCLENNKVEGCFTAADHVRKIVMNEVPGY